MAYGLQSGTEFLATYGTVIFVLMLVIATAFLLTGGTPSAIPSSCSIYGGLECMDIAYGANAVGGGTILLVRASFSVPGTLNVSAFNAIVNGVKSTTGYCTADGQASGNSLLVQGGSTICVAYIPAPSTARTTYTGTFNISANYCTGPTHWNCPASGGYTFAGSWRAQASPNITSGYITNIAPSHHALQLLFSNAQASSTGSNFQQLAFFNPSNGVYQKFERSDLGNIRFYEGQQELYSWCESGCTSSSSNALFWVKIPSGIAANSNVLINATFLSTGIEYDGGYAGEAPQLTCSNSNTMICGSGSTYAKYDNGANVFTYYTGFPGSSLPTNWNGAGAEVIANSIYVINDVGYSPYFNPNNVIAEGYEKFPTSPTGGWAIGWSGKPSPTNEQLILKSHSPDFILSTYSFGTSSSTDTGVALDTNWHVFSEWANSIAVFATIDYAHQTFDTANFPSFTSGNVAMAVAGTGTYRTAQWFRFRAVPPNNIMPSITQGPAS